MGGMGLRVAGQSRTITDLRRPQDAQIDCYIFNSDTSIYRMG
jgi:hypothetical protein